MYYELITPHKCNKNLGGCSRLITYLDFQVTLS